MAIIQNKPNMNYGVWGSNGNIAVPTSEKVDLGWIIEKPPNEMMNWVQNRQDSMLQFINQRGIPTWDSLTEYAKDSYTVRNGVLYKALSQNTDKDPTLNSAIWNISFASQTDYTNLYNDVQKIKNQKGYLTDYVQKSAPVMTADAKGVGYKDSTGVSGLTFSGVTPQVVRNNIVVAEFTGSENNNDVVTFAKLKEYLQTYKVGDLYLTTTIGNPSTILGYGTWSRYAEGKALVGFSSSTSNSTPEWVKIGGGTFGDYSHKLTPDELPSHRHGQRNNSDGGIDVSQVGIGAGDFNGTRTQTDPATSQRVQVLTDFTGGGLSHNNVQPSITIYVWCRVS